MNDSGKRRQKGLKRGKKHENIFLTRLGGIATRLGAREKGDLHCQCRVGGTAPPPANKQAATRAEFSPGLFTGWVLGNLSWHLDSKGLFWRMPRSVCDCSQLIQCALLAAWLDSIRALLLHFSCTSTPDFQVTHGRSVEKKCVIYLFKRPS